MFKEILSILGFYDKPMLDKLLVICKNKTLHNTSFLLAKENGLYYKLIKELTGKYFFNENELTKCMFCETKEDIEYIELCFNLKKLYCQNRELNTLWLQSRKLEVLICKFNHLYDLHLLNQKELRYLDCSYNKIINLNLERNTKLEILKCDGNLIHRVLDLSNNNLVCVSCEHNNITELKLQNNTNLEKLMCSGNRLNKLDLSDCPNLRILECDGNYLPILDLRHCKKLNYLSCLNSTIEIIYLSEEIKPNTLCTFIDKRTRVIYVR